MHTFESLKTFVVDDDPFYLNLFSQFLRNADLQDVQTFENGFDCLNKLHEKPDVVFLDHNMDNINGYEVLKKIKRFDPNIYVVMISAQENIKTAVDALKHGAFDYIQKGSDEEQNIQTVIEKIHKAKELLKRSKPGIFNKFRSIL